MNTLVPVHRETVSDSGGEHSSRHDAEEPRSPRRILMTADTVGGVWTYALELARALEPHSVSIALATMGALPTPEQYEEAAQIANLRLFSRDYSLEWMPEPWTDVRNAGKWLLELEARLRPDVVHLNGYVHGSLPFHAPKIVVGHSCVLSWWHSVKGEDAPTEWNHYREEVQCGLQCADLVLAPTRAMLDSLETHYGRLRRTRVIPNGRSAGLFRPGVKEAMIVTAGRLWDEAKNLAALNCVAPFVNCPILAAGEATHPCGGTLEARSLQPLGRLSAAELAQWLGRAAIYALPARYEPFGLSILEAALSGCALVVGDIPTLREVWGDAALYVPPNDTDALQFALNSLLAEPAKRILMAERAVRRAREYNLERKARGYLAAYADAMAKTGS